MRKHLYFCKHKTKCFQIWIQMHVTHIPALTTVEWVWSTMYDKVKLKKFLYNGVTGAVKTTHQLKQRHLHEKSFHPRVVPAVPSGVSQMDVIYSPRFQICLDCGERTSTFYPLKEQWDDRKHGTHFYVLLIILNQHSLTIISVKWITNENAIRWKQMKLWNSKLIKT